jgi:hypothetical protein
MPELLRSDFILSYWNLAWFILYMTGIVKTSPLFATILGAIENIVSVIYFVFMDASAYNVIKFTIINTIIKGLPLWYMIVREPSVTRESIITTALVIVLYYTWLLMNDMNLYKIYQFIGNGYIQDTNAKRKTLFSHWYDIAYEKLGIQGRLIMAFTNLFL